MVKYMPRFESTVNFTIVTRFCRSEIITVTDAIAIVEYATATQTLQIRRCARPTAPLSATLRSSPSLTRGLAGRTSLPTTLRSYSRTGGARRLSRTTRRLRAAPSTWLKSSQHLQVFFVECSTSKPWEGASSAPRLGPPLSEGGGRRRPVRWRTRFWSS